MSSTTRTCEWLGRGMARMCAAPCEGRYCAHHARVVAVREAGAALRAATEAVGRARDAVVEAARRYVDMEPRGLHVTDAVALLEQAERAEAEARARLEALR